MPTIYLTCGQEAQVDEIDYPLIVQFQWQFQAKPGLPVGYARRTLRRTTAERSWKETIYLHRFITGAPQGLVVDHFPDPCGLNCRRRNLRVCTVLENNLTRLVWRGNDYDFRGVSAVHNSNGVKFRARLGDAHLGYFRSPVDAARAYDFAATQRFGQFAFTNFPNQLRDKVRRHLIPTAEEIPF